MFSWLSDERQGARSGGVASVISSPQRVEGKAPSGNKDGQLLKKETPQVAPDITAAQGSELCPLQGEETLSVNVVSTSYESFLDYIPHTLCVAFKSLKGWKFFHPLIYPSIHSSIHPLLHPSAHLLTHPFTHPFVYPSTHPPYPSTSQIFIRFLPSPGPTRQARTLLLPLTIQGGGKGTQASKQNPRSPHMIAVKRMKQGVALKNIHNLKVEHCVLFMGIVRTSSLGSSPCPICKKY